MAMVVEIGVCHTGLLSLVRVVREWEVGVGN